LDKSLFESARSMAERLWFDHATVLEDLHTSIGFKSFRLRWVLHLLIENLRQKRKEYAIAMLPFLHAAEPDGWHHLAIGDESAVLFDPSPRRMWTLSREDGITKPKHQIQSKNFMFTILWSPAGFRVVDRLPNDTKMNRAYFATNVLTPLQQAIFPRGMAPHERRLVIHLVD
jgi:hypothetical protein